MLGNPHGLAAAVLAGSPDKAGDTFTLANGLFHGTAFAIAPGLFVTAAHVAEEARQVGSLALGRLDGPRTSVHWVQEWAVLPEDDIAFLRCALKTEVLPCLFEPLYYLTDVATYGWPVGFQVEPPVHILRAFKGHVVTRRGLYHLAGQPPGYELSFIPGPGLSGAPLLYRDSAGTVQVCGMILSSHRMEIGEKALEVGIALDIHALLSHAVEVVGGPVAERVFGRKAVQRARQA